MLQALKSCAPGVFARHWPSIKASQLLVSLNFALEHDADSLRCGYYGQHDGVLLKHDATRAAEFVGTERVISNDFACVWCGEDDCE